MKTKIPLIATVLCLSISSTLSAQYFIKFPGADPPGTGGGGGGGDDPEYYEISTLSELNWLLQNSGEWDKQFVQIANIDASETVDWDDGNVFTRKLTLIK